MKIAMVSTPFVAVPPRDYGGTELVVSELTEGLAALGHDVALFATGDSSTRSDLRCFYPRAAWPPNVMDDLNHVSWAMQEVIHDGFDVVHVHSAGALAFGRLIPGIPLVYTLHHVRDETLSNFYRYFPDVTYVAISEDQRRREVQLPRMEVIHHALDPGAYEWTTKPEDYVLFIGRFAEIKGLHTAVDAAARAGVRIRVAGDTHPVDREYGEREVTPRLRQPHVEYFGTVGMDRKVPLLRDARALLVPIEWDEPFGLVMIEAMLSGCPVVAFPRGSVPELVEEGRTGFVVRDMEDMVRTIRPGGPLDGFDRRRCRERAEARFGRRRMVEEYAALYERLRGCGGQILPRRPARPELEIARTTTGRPA